MLISMSGLGECPKLLASYLDNRAMFVDNTGTSSECAEITRGVPQGSVIAPLLFSLYYSDVVTHFAEQDTILYADDTAVVCSTPNLALTMSSLQNSAQVVDMYLIENDATQCFEDALYAIWCIV